MIPRVSVFVRAPHPYRCCTLMMHDVQCLASLVDFLETMCASQYDSMMTFLKFATVRTVLPVEIRMTIHRFVMKDLATTGSFGTELLLHWLMHVWELVTSLPSKRLLHYPSLSDVEMHMRKL